MKFPHIKVVPMTIFAFVFLLSFSCSKDSDLLSEYALADDAGDLVINTYLVDDRYTTYADSSIILDVLSNDIFTDEENVKIVETSPPINGEVIIIENKTLLYIPEQAAAPEENGPEETPAPDPVPEETPAPEETPEAETDTFTYTTEVSNEDETVTTETATVTVEVVPPSDNGEQDVSGLKTVAEFKADFDAYWSAEEKGWYTAISTSGNEGDIYYLDGIQALVTMFQATGDTDYMDDAIRLIKNIMATAKPSSSLPQYRGYNDSYLSWHSNSSTSVTGQGLSGDGGQAPLYETRGFQHVAKLLWVLYESPNLRASRYQSDYQAILDFVETHIWEKWFSRDDWVPYRLSIDGTAGWARIGFFLHKITGDSKYRLVFDRFNTNMNYGTSAKSMREILKSNSANSSGYQWTLLWSGNSYEGSSVTDLDHSNRAVLLMVDAHEFGDYWTDSDMNKLVNTWNVFWPSGDGSSMKKFLDGTGGNDGALVEPGWIKLGRFNKALQTRLETRNLHYAIYDQVVCLNYAELAYNRAYMGGTIVYPENR